MEGQLVRTPHTLTLTHAALVRDEKKIVLVNKEALKPTIQIATSAGKLISSFVVRCARANEALHHCSGRKGDWWVWGGQTTRGSFAWLGRSTCHNLC